MRSSAVAHRVGTSSPGWSLRLVRSASMFTPGTLQSAWLQWRHNEFVDPDRKPSLANARRVPDCVRDRAGRARDADFTDPLDAKRVHVRIVFLDHEGFQAWYVGVHRDVVFGEVRVDDPAGTVVADGLLVKRERYAPDHTAIDLAAEIGSALPYISEIIEQIFDLSSLRFARLVQLTPNTVLVPHRDFVELDTEMTRIHVPLRTSPSCLHGEGRVVFHMQVGEIWYLNAGVVHTAASFARETRTHLMLDFRPTDDLRKLLRIECDDDEDIPAANLATRPPFTSRDEEALHALDRIIDLENYRDVLALLIRKYFRRNVPVSVIFEWLMDIVKRSRNEDLLDVVRKFSNRCLIERDD